MPNITGHSPVTRKSMDIKKKSIDLDEVANTQKAELDLLVDALRHSKHQRNGRRNKLFKSVAMTTSNKKALSKFVDKDGEADKALKKNQQLPTLEIPDRFGSDDLIRNRDL